MIHEERNSACVLRLVSHSEIPHRHGHPACALPTRKARVKRYVRASNVRFRSPQELRLLIPPSEHKSYPAWHPWCYGGSNCSWRRR
jgi:hypothetical protein